MNHFTPHPPFGHLLPLTREKGSLALSRSRERVAEGRVRAFPRYSFSSHGTARISSTLPPTNVIMVSPRRT